MQVAGLRNRNHAEKMETTFETTKWPRCSFPSMLPLQSRYSTEKLGGAPLLHIRSIACMLTLQSFMF